MRTPAGQIQGKRAGGYWGRMVRTIRRTPRVPGSLTVVLYLAPIVMELIEGAHRRFAPLSLARRFPGGLRRKDAGRVQGRRRVFYFGTRQEAVERIQCPPGGVWIPGNKK